MVDTLGDGVDPSRLGRRAVAHLGPVPGSYAEQAVTAVDGQLFAVPGHVPAATASAALPGGVPGPARRALDRVASGT